MNPDQEKRNKARADRGEAILAEYAAAQCPGEPPWSMLIDVLIDLRHATKGGLTRIEFDHAAWVAQAQYYTDLKGDDDTMKSPQGMDLTQADSDAHCLTVKRTAKRIAIAAATLLVLGLSGIGYLIFAT